MRYALLMSNDLHSIPLYWEASYQIVLCLMDRYPHVDVEQVGMRELYEWVIGLPNFADDPSFVNDDILNDILREWYEETNTL